ncbi:MAG: hypothetical protein Q7J34_12745 [Bacteroidales bacterium]|jgi:hypothetical protein|nr:hypothetical protein [Bacteroidales bacterium]
MIKYLFFLIGLISGLTIFAQKESAENQKPVLTINGFVRADAAFDTRMVVDAREGFFLFYPKKELLDKNGEDINARAGFNQYATMSRLSGTITGPVFMNTKASAIMEADFTGHSNEDNNGFRLRHAYIKLEWEKAKLITGQYWTPMDIPEALPRVYSLNTGAPFHSFNRSPQIRFEYRTGRLNWIFAALSQRDLTSTGPAGPSQTYLRTGLVPNLHLQLQYKSENFQCGSGIDYKQLAPKTVTDSLLKTKELVRSVSAVAFAKITTKPLDIIVQGVYGQNLFEHLMLGGYAVEKIDTASGKQEYINLNHLSVWADISTRTAPVKAGFFAGYAKNLGTHRDATKEFYGRGNDIESLFRVSGRLQYTYQALAVMTEIEFTRAAYGIPDLRYQFANTDGVDNIRIQLSIAYYF